MGDMSIEEVLLILNSLIYSGGINSQESIIDRNIYDIVSAGVASKPRSEFFSEEKWTALLETVKQNEAYFSNIIIRDIEYVEGAQKNVCFSNLNTGETYVVFRGTATLEWHDNADGGVATITDTKQQIKALEFLNTMGEKYGDIIASGHSKGGNKAQYCAILSDYVVKAYSFDGQGFGAGFRLKYAESIKMHANKVISISNRSDYVNVLFRGIASEYRYLDNGEEIYALLVALEADGIFNQHSPLMMFEIIDGQARMRKYTTKQDEVVILLGNLLYYFQNRMTIKDFRYLSNLIMHAVEDGDCGADFDFLDMPEGFLERFSGLILMLREEAGIGMEEMGVFVTVILGVVPDLPPILKDLFKDMSVSNMYQSLQKINRNIVTAQLDYDYRNSIRRDFSQAMQVMMAENVVNPVEGDIHSLVPSLALIEEGLSSLTFMSNHKYIVSTYEKLQSDTMYAKQMYEKVIEDVYAEDTRMSEKINAIGSELDGHISRFL